MAVYPVIPGAPDYSSTSTNAYIPAIYSALLIKKFYPQTIFGKISNTDYEGDIKTHGDTVNIRTRPTIETFRYKKGMVLPVQNPESPFVTLKIDQGEGFSFAIDKVDEFQSDIKLMNVWAEDASKQMQQVIDRNVLISLAAAGAKTANGQDTSANVVGYTTLAGPTLDQYTVAKGAIVATATTAKGTTIAKGTAPGTMGTAASQITGMGVSANIVTQILYYGRLMDENNVPEDGRFIILPAVYMQVLKDISAPFGQAYATGQNVANILSGNIPKIDRFEVLYSNNMPATNTGTNGHCILFGHKYATTFATQITESRIIDNPFAFGKMMQGLQIYGFNVIKPQLLGVDFWQTA